MLEVLAWPAGIIGAGMAVPQAVKAARGKVDGIAPATWLASFAVTLAWAVWGFKAHNPALAATNVVAAGTSLGVVAILAARRRWPHGWSLILAPLTIGATLLSMSGVTDRSVAGAVNIALPLGITLPQLLAALGRSSTPGDRDVTCGVSKSTWVLSCVSKLLWMSSAFNTDRWLFSANLVNLGLDTSLLLIVLHNSGRTDERIARCESWSRTRRLVRGLEIAAGESIPRGRGRKRLSESDLRKRVEKWLFPSEPDGQKIVMPAPARESAGVRIG